MRHCDRVTLRRSSARIARRGLAGRGLRPEPDPATGGWWGLLTSSTHSTDRLRAMRERSASGHVSGGGRHGEGGVPHTSSATGCTRERWATTIRSSGAKVRQGTWPGHTQRRPYRAGKKTIHPPKSLT